MEDQPMEERRPEETTVPPPAIPSSPPPGYFFVPPPMGYQSSPLPPRVRPEFSNLDSLFAALSVILGFLFVNLIMFAGDLALSVTLFTFVFAAFCLVYFKKSGISQTKESLCYLVLTLAFGVYFLIFDGRDLNVLALFALIFCAAYWIYVSCGLRCGKTLSGFFPGEALNTIFALPISRFFYLASAIKRYFKNSRKTFNIWLIILGIVIALPVTAIVLAQLVSADAAFANLWNRIYQNIFREALKYIGQFILGIPIAFYLFGLIGGGVKKNRHGLISEDSMKSTAEKARKVPQILACAAITPLLLVYILYAASQLSYFISAFGNILPEGFSYAEYARRGFFELFNVSIINLAISAAAVLFVKREGKIKAVRGFLIILSGFTLILLATAIAKMVMYISVYAMTPARIYASLIMLFLGVVFIWLIVWLARQRLPLGKWILRTAVVFAIVLFFSNINWVVSRYNISAYMSGRMDTVDTYMLSSLGSEGVIALRYLELHAPDSIIRNDAHTLLEYRYQEINDYRQINIAKIRANNCLDKASDDNIERKNP